jgi:hypothetical protein
MNLKMSRLAVRTVSLALVALLAFLGGTSAFAADVTAIAGTGVGGYAGDGGPAIAARLRSPHGMAVAADGTVYIADTDNYRVRRISPAGIITTVAGTGTWGDTGDGGQATAAQLSGLLSLALSPPGDTLYIADIDNNRVRQIDLGTGVITNFAGTGFLGFGYAGDGGPAQTAWLQMPEGVATDADGNVYIGDVLNCVVRKVDIVTNIISRVAGVPGSCTPGGDGGSALAARFSIPRRVALDAAGNLYVLDTGSRTVRRVNATTGIITTVAGGGSTTPGFGSALTMNLGAPSDLVLDAANNDLYIANFNRVFKVDLGTGILSVFAGTGATGFSGDGGPAQDATFQDIGGLARRGTDILIADSGNNRIRAVVPPPLPDDLVIDLATSPAFLNSLNAVPGSILMVNVDGREYLLIPNATSVGLDVTLTGNDQLLVVDLGALQSAGGSINIAGNLTLQSIDMSGLTTVGGSMNVTNNPALNVILISGVTTIGSDLTVVGTAATVIDMSSLITVGGSLNVGDNSAATAIDMTSLTSVGGDLTVSGNTTVSAIDLGGITTMTGNIDVSGNTSAASIDLSALTTVGGSVTIGDNTTANPIDMSSLTSTAGNLTVTGNASVVNLDLSNLSSSGSVDIAGNASAATIDLSGLSTVTGDLTVVDNGAATVDMSGGTDVGGSVTIETTGSGPLSMGDGTVTGDLTLDAAGYTDMSGTTPGGALDLTATRLEAVMHLQIPAASFTTPVSFSVTRLDPVALVPESGLNASGSTATIDPIAAYQFTFSVPTLDRDAELSFDIVLAQLDAAARTALLDALAAGTATLVSKGDGAGSRFQAFPVCGSADTPTAGGCVRVETFDADGRPTAGAPARVRFSGVVGHFSTWAVATVTRVSQVNRTVLCSALGGHRLPDVHLFSFIGGKDEIVTVKLAASPAGTFTPGRAALTLFGINLFRLDATELPNTITATLPRTGNYFVTVAELLLRTGNFKGDYCVSVESTQNAWQTVHRM